MTPTKLVLDAGPLIALFFAQDRDHEAVRDGFARLIATQTRFIVPAAILLEASKRLFFLEGRQVMRRATAVMLDQFNIVDVDEQELRQALDTANQLEGWNGTLEDAIVANVALRLKLPLWTMNYRDLAAFREIEFWNP
jgi:predicted nucleic acid-binding protein